MSLSDEQFDAVTATYDFSALCRVTKAIYLSKHASDQIRCKAIEELLNRCLGLHEQVRNPVMHATWSMTGAGYAARHVARPTHKVTYPFEKAEQVDEKTTLVDRANSDVFTVLGGMN